MKILIVEDEKTLSRITKEELEKEGYSVETAERFKEAENKIAVSLYDCVLLDIMLPDGNGLDLLRQIKQDSNETGVIILSAKDSIEDKVNGLDLGADDYMPKPYHLAELSARIKSVIRRKNRNAGLGTAYGNLRLETSEKQAFVMEKPLPLSKKEYEILEFFVNRADRLIDKNTLAEFVWGDNFDYMDNYDFIYAQMKNLRKKLNEGSANVELKSIYGLGYKLTIKAE